MDLLPFPLISSCPAASSGDSKLQPIHDLRELFELAFPNLQEKRGEETCGVLDKFLALQSQ